MFVEVSVKCFEFVVVVDYDQVFEIVVIVFGVVYFFVKGCVNCVVCIEVNIDFVVVMIVFEVILGSNDIWSWNFEFVVQVVYQVDLECIVDFGYIVMMV